MIDLGTYTIKDMMNKDATSGEESQPPKQAAPKTKGRKRKNHHAKSKATVESDNSESNDNDHSQKSNNKVGVKSSKDHNPLTIEDYPNRQFTSDAQKS